MTDKTKTKVLELLNDVDKALGKIRDDVDVFTRKKLSMQIIAIELAICYLEEEDKHEEDKKPHELTCTCGDCKYYNPCRFNLYGEAIDEAIGRCFAQKDAPFIQRGDKPCAMFDWKKESEDKNKEAGLSPVCDFYGREGCHNCKGCDEQHEDESEVSE